MQKVVACILMPISLFSIEKDSEAVPYIEKAIQFNSTNKYTERTWDFSDISAVVERSKPSQCTLIKDLISLIQNETTYPTIRFDQINIEQEDAGNYAEVAHPFVGHKTIRKGDDSLKMVIKNLGTAFIYVGLYSVISSPTLCIEENTIVIFMSDNGAGGGIANYPLRGGKSNFFEGVYE